MWIVSACSLTIVMAGCLVGIFAPKHIYDDNIAQRLGMVGVFCFCWPRLSFLLESHELTGRFMPVEAQLAGHVGMAVFTLGTAYKAWRHNSKFGRRNPPPLPPLNENHLQGVIGGHK